MLGYLMFGRVPCKVWMALVHSLHWFMRLLRAIVLAFTSDSLFVSSSKPLFQTVVIRHILFQLGGLAWCGSQVMGSLVSRLGHKNLAITELRAVCVYMCVCVHVHVHVLCVCACVHGCMQAVC